MEQPIFIFYKGTRGQPSSRHHKHRMQYNIKQSLPHILPHPPPCPTYSSHFLPPSQKTQLTSAPFPGSAQPPITCSMVNPLMQAMESWAGPGCKASSPGSVGNMLMSLDSSACMNRTTLVLPHVIQIPNPLCSVLNPDRTTVRGRT